MLKSLIAFFLMFISTSACSGERSFESEIKNKPESVTVYSKSHRYTQEQSRGLRAIAEMKCKSGNNSYCVDLAKMLFKGFGGKVDSKRATLLLKKSCNNGYKMACDQSRK